MSFLFVYRGFLLISSANKLPIFGVNGRKFPKSSFTSFAILQIYKMSSQSWVQSAVTDQHPWRPGTVIPPGHYLNPLCNPEENSGIAHPISHLQGHSAPGSAGSNLGGPLPISNQSFMYTPKSESSSSSNLGYRYLSTCQHLHTGPQPTATALHSRPVKQHRGV